jgi:RNA polymerase sigma-70 factor, ECF subfamily
MSEKQPLTLMLAKASEGDKTVLDQVMTLVYRELKLIARRSLRSARHDAIMCPTALINEAYIRLLGAGISFRDRVHFYAVASKAMRMILIDHVRAGQRLKRAGAAVRVTFNPDLAVEELEDERLLAMDEALQKLEERDSRKARAIELLYFGGLSYSEIAAELNVSEATVHTDLKFAKAWLARQLR